MLNFLDNNDWEKTYNENFLEKLNFLKDALETGNTQHIEYWYVVSLSSAFELLVQYFAQNGEILHKKKDLINIAASKGIITDKENWLEALKLSDRIGRAVRAKEENISIIKDKYKLFEELTKKFEQIITDKEKMNI